MSYPNPAVRILIIDCRIDLYESFSLKNKRRIRQRLIERLKHHFNLSVAETGEQDTWRVLDLSMAYVALNEASALRMRDRLAETVSELLQSYGELREWNWEIL